MEDIEVIGPAGLAAGFTELEELLEETDESYDAEEDLEEETEEVYQGVIDYTEFFNQIIDNQETCTMSIDELKNQQLHCEIALFGMLGIFLGAIIIYCFWMGGRK